MIQYFSIFQLIIIANTIYQINNSINKFKTIFDFLLLPLILYYAIGHLFLSNKIAKSIGWKSSPFQTELGFFTMSIFIVGLYASINNNSNETLKFISYIWILFIIMTALNHIKEIIYDKNYSFNNIYPIFITIITICFEVYYI